jgi:hypothetical protein
MAAPTVTEIRSTPLGLMTALSPVQCPPGALLEATNVVIRTPGTVEPRPGFAPAVTPGGIEPDGIIPFPRSDNTTDQNILTDGAQSRWSDGTDLEDDDGGDLTWLVYSGTVSRRSMYIHTADALRVVHEPGADTAYRAGVPAPALSTRGLHGPSFTTGAGPSYPTAGYRAYRAVTRRGYDSTGQSHIARSAPSQLLIAYEGTAPANKTIFVYLHTGDDFQPGDVIELYSGELSATFPTDELYLNQTVSITSAHITAGYIELYDDVPDANLGMALYTNESREGQEAAHFRPPLAGCSTEFNGSLWLGDLTYPASMTVSVRTKIAGTETDAALVGRHSIAGDFTNGSVNVINVSAPDIAELRVGMIIYSGSTKLRVATLAATSFTLSAVWPGATATDTVAAHDSIRIGSEYYVVGDLVPHIRGARGEHWTSVDDAGSTLYTAEFDSVNMDEEALVELNSDYYWTPTWRIETLLPSTTPPQVWATRGDLYTPALPEPSAATGYQMPQDVLPDYVAWSNQEEPDHFTFENVERAGRSGCKIYALAPSRNSVLIATDLGMWRASGYADSGITFDEHDEGVRILGRRCAAEVGPYVYVAADSGVFECDENECRDITTHVIDDMDDKFQTILEQGRVSRLRLTANGKNDEVIVCMPDTFNPEDSIEDLYVFNQSTRAWTHWTFPHDITDLVQGSPSRSLTAGVLGDDATLNERARNSTSSETADDQYTVTVNAVTDLEVTIAAGSGWSPSVGDVVFRTVAYIITAVEDATTFTVHRTGLPTGSATAYEAFTCTITPTINIAKNPSVLKVWGEGAIWWNMRAGVSRIGLRFRSAVTGEEDPTSQTRTLAVSPTANRANTSRAGSSRFTVPRAHGRSTHLTTTLEITQALARWEYDGLAVKCRVLGDRVKSVLG